MERTCKKCGTSKSLDEFRRHKGRKYGRDSVCKKCLNKPQKPKQILLEGFKQCSSCKAVKQTDAFSNTMQTPDGKYPKCRQCRKDYRDRKRDVLLPKKREYYYAHKEELLLKQKEYALKNRDVICAKKRIYYQDNKEAFKAYEEAHKEERAEWRKVYYAENREDLCAAAREYNRTHKEKIAARDKLYNELHPEKRKEARQTWYANNHEKKREYSKQYRTDNPEMTRYHDRLRKSRKLAVDEMFTPAHERFVRAFWGSQCAVCGQTQSEEAKALAIDHWLPLSKGHALTMENATLLCISCNSKKKDRYPAEVFDVVTIARIEGTIQAQAEAWKIEMAVVDNRQRRFV